MTRWILKSSLLTILVSGCFGQSTSSPKASPFPLPFRMTSDGRACSGYLHVTARSLVWKSSWSTFRASSWTATNKNGIWVFELKQTDLERKQHPLGVIEMHPHDPDNHEKYAVWEVAGYESMEKYLAHPDLPVLDCGMQ